MVAELVYEVFKDLYGLFSKKGGKVPTKKFLREYERKIGTKLSKESQRNVLDWAEEEGARVLTSKNGHEYVVFEKIY